MKTRQHTSLQLASKKLTEMPPRGGFTLVEIIVSFTILAIVSASLIVAVTGMLGIQQRDNQARDDASSVEAAIATGTGTPSSGELSLALGGNIISGSVDTYSQGISSYTVLDPGMGPAPATIILDGRVSNYQETVIVKTGYYKIEVWGASGGGNGLGPGLGYGGRGGYAVGIVELTEGDELFLTAGRQGDTRRLVEGAAGGSGGGGAFDGGHAGWRTMSGFIFGNGGGGGSSDVRIGENSVYARLIVAGGGGGAGTSGFGEDNAGDRGGAGGGTNGINGSSPASTHGLGGAQSNGGATGNSGDAVNGPGSFGLGGSVMIADRTGGGGGGGWYGGGAGSWSGGGGGSGWVLTKTAYINWMNNSDRNLYKLVDTGSGESDYWMTHTSLVAGSTSMPNPRAGDTPMTGMTGNGYVRITWVGVSVE